MASGTTGRSEVQRQLTRIIAFPFHDHILCCANRAVVCHTSTLCGASSALPSGREKLIAIGASAPVRKILVAGVVKITYGRVNFSYTSLRRFERSNTLMQANGRRFIMSDRLEPVCKKFRHAFCAIVIISATAYGLIAVRFSQHATAGYAHVRMMLAARPAANVVRRFGRHGEGDIAWYGRCTGKSTHRVQSSGTNHDDEQYARSARQRRSCMYGRSASQPKPTTENRLR
jgi:hypothetical protein